MPLSAAALLSAAEPPMRSDPLAAALCAAELGDPVDLARAPTSLARELCEAMPRLRVSVPYATLQLLTRLALDVRADVRVSVVRALPWLFERYPERVEHLLVQLACDPVRRVRQVVAQALADALESSTDPWALIARWERHADLAREVLAAARKNLPPPLGR